MVPDYYPEPGFGARFSWGSVSDLETAGAQDESWVDPNSNIALQPLPRQQIIRRAPAGKLRHPAEPSMDRRMTYRKIIASFLFGIREIADHRYVGHGSALPDDE